MSVDELIDSIVESEISGIDVVDGLAAAPAGTFCAAFAQTRLGWVDGQVVPLQLWIDAWTGVTDVPVAAEPDVMAVQHFAEQKMDWNFGRIDRDDRPVLDDELAASFERIADAAVDRCDELPLRVGIPDWADPIEPAEPAVCAASRAELERGIELYRGLRGHPPGHAEQIELVNLREFLATFGTDESTELWFAPEHHGIDPSGAIVAMPSCSD